MTVPEPPQQFTFPELLPKTGSVLLSADRITVADRMTSEVSCVLSRGDRLVVTGPNGAGKSTLLSLLAGELHPTTGDVRRSKGLRLGFLRQETDLPVHRRASEAYSAHLDTLIAAGILDSSEAVGLSQLGLLRARESSKRIGELSMGQQRRLDLAIVLATKPHVLLLDEPTNHLSVALVDELTDALSATPAAVVVSTHDRQLLADVHDWPALHLATAPVREASA